MLLKPVEHFRLSKSERTKSNDITGHKIHMRSDPYSVYVRNRANAWSQPAIPILVRPNSAIVTRYDWSTLYLSVLDHKLVLPLHLMVRIRSSMAA